MSERYDLIIIGSGPAGLSAAIYAQRAKLDTLVLEESYISGGQVLNTYEVDNYPGLPGLSGMELSKKFREHADKLGMHFEQGRVERVEVRGIKQSIQAECIEDRDKEQAAQVESIEDRDKNQPAQKPQTSGGEQPVPVSESSGDASAQAGGYFIVHTDKQDYEARCVVVATGARHRKMEVPGEEELAGRGVSYCATCDGAFFRDKTVAVIGGGDVAAEDAIFLARTCKKVYVVHRRNELRAAAILRDALLAQENVEMVWDNVLTRIEGADQAERIAVKNVKTQEERLIPVDGVFIAVGILPNTESFAGLADMDKGGYFLAGEDCATSTPGIFAAGDVRAKPLRQILTAASDGACAVVSVQKYLV